MILFFIVVLIIGLITSCTHTATPHRAEAQKQQEQKRVDASGSKNLENYFLSNLPSWANFSTSGKCLRNEMIYFLNIPKMRENFNLSYTDALQIQFLFNKKISLLRKGKNEHRSSLADENIMFFEAKEEIINNGLKPFLVPNFINIHLVWIDPFIKNEQELLKLKNFLALPEGQQGQPIFISLCLTAQEMNDFISKNGFDDIDIRIIPTEIFSVFNGNNEHSYHFTLDVKQFFNKKQQLNMILPENIEIPLELQGDFKIKKRL